MMCHQKWLVTLTFSSTFFNQGYDLHWTLNTAVLAEFNKNVKIKSNFAKVIIAAPPLPQLFRLVWPLSHISTGNTVHISVFFSQGAQWEQE